MRRGFSTLLPDRDQRLHLLGTRQPVVHHPAVFMGTLMESPDGIQTEIRRGYASPYILHDHTGPSGKVIGATVISGRD